MNLFYIVLIIFGSAILWIIYAYNRLIKLRYRAKEALSDIDVQLKRRYDLIPNLVEAVKGYLQYERTVLEDVTKARAGVLAGVNKDPLERDEAENMLANTLKTLFAVAENYPDLKANANFLDLQRELADTENKIQASRRFYNTTVRDLNTMIGVFPVNIIARLFNFYKEKFFATENAEEKKPIKVKF